MVWAKARATVRGAESSGDRGCALVGRVLARSAGVRGAMAAGLALVMVSGVAGCARDDAVAGGSPSGSGGSATASGSGVSRPRGSGVSTPAPSEDPLFTEAKAVHLKYVEEMVKLDRAGGADALPASMKAVVGGDFEKALKYGYAEMKVKNFRETTSEKWKVTDVWPIKADGSHAVGVGACVDFTKFHYESPDGSRKGDGTMRRDEVQLSRRGGTLVITDGSSKQVEKCER